MTQPDDRLLEQVPWLRLLFAHMAGRGVRARVDIDDLVQEAVLRAYRVRETLPGDDEGLRRYLMTIARNCVFDVLRAARRRSGPESHGRIERDEWTQIDDPAAWTAGPATRVANLDRDQRLHAAFLETDDGHRQRFTFDECTAERIDLEDQQIRACINTAIDLPHQVGFHQRSNFAIDANESRFSRREPCLGTLVSDGERSRDAAESRK